MNLIKQGKLLLAIALLSAGMVACGGGGGGSSSGSSSGGSSDSNWDSMVWDNDNWAE
ncbi:MAG: hypothetical protein AAF434_00310 [Pseudomonadota bacterium]